jgi:ABC-type nitrate/sulfonate/bicarbonate transport system substrate-binding protein
VLRDGEGIDAALGFIAVARSALEDAAQRAALVDYIRRRRAANDWARAHREPYVDVFTRVTCATPEVARLVVSRQNPWLVAPDAAMASELQRVADRFYAKDVLPTAVDGPADRRQHLRASRGGALT